jgi:hypothetical protein
VSVSVFIALSSTSAAVRNLRDTDTYVPIDVRDEKFGRTETAGIERLINGIALTQSEDEARIALGSQLFDALYETWRRKKS